MRYRRGGRRRYWHGPEHIAGQAARDQQLGRTRFHVYVLGTDYGHYVGHTWNVQRRFSQHLRGEVPSTSGGNPVLLWQSRVFQARADAAAFEAALKSWRDQRSPRFREVTGFDPVRFDNPAFRRGGVGVGCLLPVLAALVVCWSLSRALLLIMGVVE